MSSVSPTFARVAWAATYAIVVARLIPCMFLWVLVGCGEDTIFITLHLPAAYEHLKNGNQIQIEVFEVAPKQPRSCEDHAYGELATDTAVVTTPAIKFGGAGTIVDIPRLGDKVLVARVTSNPASNAVGGVLRLVGCTALGDVLSDLSLEIMLEPAARIALDPASAMPSLPGDVTLAVVGPDGEPLPGHQVKIQSVGPIGASKLPADTGMTVQADGEGMATIHVARAQLAGPQDLVLVPRWPAENPTVLHGYNEPRLLLDEPLQGLPSASIQQAAIDAIIASGTFGPEGRMAYAQLGPSTPTGRDLVVIYHAAGGLVARHLEAGNTLLLAVVRDGADERLVALGPDTWRTLRWDGRARRCWRPSSCRATVASTVLPAFAVVTLMKRRTRCS